MILPRRSLPQYKITFGLTIKRTFEFFSSHSKPNVVHLSLLTFITSCVKEPKVAVWIKKGTQDLKSKDACLNYNLITSTVSVLKLLLCLSVKQVMNTSHGYED